MAWRWSFACLLVLFMIITTVDCGKSEVPPSDKFVGSIQNQNKTKVDASAKRREQHVTSVRRVAAHNQQYAAGKVKYKLDLNKFADLSDEEKKKYLGIPRGVKPIRSKAQLNVKSIRTRNARYDVPPTFPIVAKTTKFALQNATKGPRVGGPTGLPTSIDYRDTGFVSHVKNQKSCGSCWSFSTTGVLEGQMPQLRSLAEQQLVDCATIDSPYGGCEGAWPVHALEWMRDNNKQLGLQTSYPYVATKGTCKVTNDVGVNVTTVEVVPENDENALITAIANKGPVSITINADDLFLYKEGIYDNQQCGKGVNHAVLAVGYGTQNGQDYYIIKNSWGEDWGENGFMRMAKGSNMCGIVSEESAYASIAQNSASKLECVDQSPYCLSWAKSGYCATSPTYMNEKCKAACTKCSSPRVYVRSCSDKNSGCAALAANGECPAYWQYVLYTCPKACQICDKWVGYFVYPDWLLKAAKA